MRFLREIIILILILVFVIATQNITRNITEKSLKKLEDKIADVEKSVYSENKENKIEELSNIWKNEESKLAYYMEHNELEEISSKMTNSKKSIENEKIDEAIEYLDEIKFRIEHIKNKQKLEFKNIF